MTQEVLLLAGAALTTGIVHTALGPDHYVPFIAMARSRSWSIAKTTWITALAGVAHVLGSVAAVALALALGGYFDSLNMIETLRSNIVGWGLITVGGTYALWGLRETVASKVRPLEKHMNKRISGTLGKHSANLLLWSLLVVILLGPCEPLIPFLMMPSLDVASTTVILLTFMAATVGTMLSLVTVGVFGLARVQFAFEFPLRRYAHSLAGAAIALCGVGVQFFGL